MLFSVGARAIPRSDIAATYLRVTDRRQGPIDSVGTILLAVDVRDFSCLASARWDLLSPPPQTSACEIDGEMALRRRTGFRLFGEDGTVYVPFCWLRLRCGDSVRAYDDAPILALLASLLPPCCLR